MQIKKMWVDFDANKKNAGGKIKMTPRKIQTPVFSLPVNHRHPCSGPVFKNQLTGTKVFFSWPKGFYRFSPRMGQKLHFLMAVYICFVYLILLI